MAITLSRPHTARLFPMESHGNQLLSTVAVQDNIPAACAAINPATLRRARSSMRYRIHTWATTRALEWALAVLNVNISVSICDFQGLEYIATMGHTARFFNASTVNDNGFLRRFFSYRSCLSFIATSFLPGKHIPLWPSSYFAKADTTFYSSCSKSVV
jgi:hypothetical protein